MSSHLLYAVPDPDQPSESAPSGQAMPHAPDAERAVLGAAMLSRTTAVELAGILEPADFYAPKHELIFTAILDLLDAGKPTDPIVLAHHLGIRELARLGGAPYLHDCMHSIPTAANGAYYAQIVLDHARGRRVMQTGARIAQMGRDLPSEPDLLAVIHAEIHTLMQVDQRNWPEPVPLRITPTVPQFPVGALPTWVRAKAAAVAHEIQVPVDLPGTLALACLATAAGGRVRVQVRPHTGWIEPVNLYTVCALPPGTRKTPVFNSMAAPILAVERRLQEEMRPRITALAVDRKAADEYAARVADQLAKADAMKREAIRLEAHAAAIAAQEIVVPTEPRLFTDDATAESLTSLVVEHGGSFAVLSAESEIFNEMAGRYSNKPNLNIFLKGHAGDPLRGDRKTRVREAVDEPALTLGVCTQPAVLAELAAIPGAASRGLLDRFVYAIPEVNIGYRDTDPVPANPNAHTDYARDLSALILSLRDLDEPIRLTLTPAAATLLGAVAEQYEQAQREDGPLFTMRQWASKAVGTMMRIAGLLHTATHLHDGIAQPISMETVTAAHQLIEYYTGHAQAAFDAMTTDPVTDRATHLLAWISNTQPIRFTSRDAFKALQRRIPRMADLTPALALLEQHGYLRRMPAPPSQGRGRPPTPTYETNPKIGHSIAADAVTLRD